MKLLDLFAGCGGAATGYAQAGFEVIGVDIAVQPNYPFSFLRVDALQVLEFIADKAEPWPGAPGFDVIHASPPCQGYTPMSNRWGSDVPKLIEPVRELLKATGLPYVIENVPGAPLKNSIRVCGSFFGLTAYRHRLFESDMALWSTPCSHTVPGIAVYGKPDGRRLFTRADGSELRAWASVEEGQKALGIDWTDNPDELREAIPPVFTEYVGKQIIEQLERGTT